MSQCTEFHTAGLHPFIWSRVSGLMQFLTADQKQQDVKVCKELCQIASDDPTFLSRVIISEESWIYGMTLRQSNSYPIGK
jgi:hypothetical protein